jgi:DNA primase
MTIQELKQSLSIEEVLNHYGLKPDKNKMLNCPFHQDKTPSMQIYPETNTAYCFSSNCKLNGKSIDQIDFIMYKENYSKHEAIEKAKQLSGIIEKEEKKLDCHNIFPELRKNLLRSQKAQKYLKTRNINYIEEEIGYNYRTLKQQPESITFPLKNKEGKIVSLYGRSITNKQNNKHYYTKERQGLYPGYPEENTQTLIIAESIIDAISIKQTITPEKTTATLALYGTNGLTFEHKNAILSLKKLKEIIIFLDGDEAGKKATEKYIKELQELLPQITISQVKTPEGEDANNLIQNHEKKIINYLLEKREKIFGKLEKNTTLQKCIKTLHICKKLDTRDTNYLYFNNKNLQITILGGINLYPLDHLKVTLKLEKTQTYNPLHKIRHSLDLYNDDQVERLITKTSERLEISSKELQITITELIEELENYREEQIANQKTKNTKKRQLTETRQQKAIKFLQEPNLLQKTNELINQSGVVGEETNRLLMYLIFTSRLREQPLHIISLGASGTGKTYLQEKISQLIPEEQKLEITTLSENALYYFEKQELKNKLVLIEDLDGAQDDKIMYALRELMSKKQITKTIPIKDSKGNLKTITLQVEGPISLSGTTTREKLYEDNANRSILIYLDNSKTQKEKIMNYQRKLSSGQINKQKEEEIKELIKDIQSILKPIKIINPYAEKLKIPETDFKPLRTNAHYLNFIEIITFYKQYQRTQKTDKNGEKHIESTLEDIKEANQLLKEVLLNKSDELTKATRNFLEKLKNNLEKENKTTFYKSEIRKKIKINPHNLKYYLNQLQQYEYIKIIGGNRYKQGYEYELENQNEYKNLKNKIENTLNKILENLEANVANSG